MADWFEDPSIMIIVVVMTAVVALLNVAICASGYQRVPPNKVLLKYGRPLRVNLTEENVAGIRLGQDIRANDVFKVVLGSKGELSVEKVTSGVEG